LKNFTIGASLTEEELLGPGDAGFQRVSELLGSLKPFVSVFWWLSLSLSAHSLLPRCPFPTLRPHRTMEGDLAGKSNFPWTGLAGVAFGEGSGKSNQVNIQCRLGTCVVAASQLR
jgi:hypothetical protein